ncbi:MAG TPA: NAD(P)H-hydrate epimerase [Candidatus Limnocylindrales bacterium]|nr:NAD(P)H-hydrate epimerase [Candidatus Limnocylindrales bacterium]
MSLAALPAVAGVPTATAAQMARADRAAIDELGISEAALMENAAHQVARVARLILGGTAGRRIVALAGPGTNGGDALAAARHLFGWGADVRAVLSHEREALRPLCHAQAETLERSGVRVARADPDGVDEMAGADLLLDGLLGTSARGAPRDAIAELIRRANRTGAPILAVDLPSGLDPDTGEPLGIAIRAACTVTLALPKAGLLRPPARPLTGELVLADIGMPAAAHERADLDVAALFGQGDLVRIIT